MNKFLIIFATLMAVASAASVASNSNSTEIEFDADAEWDRWKATYNKTFQCPEAEQRYKETFVKKLKMVKKLNKRYKAGKTTFKTKVYRWAHLNETELLRLRTGSILPDSEIANQATETVNAAINVALSANGTGDSDPGVDWRALGKVSPVKNQGGCGSCWAFAATGALESQYMIKYNKSFLLSEQYLVDCSNYYNYGCGGGNAYNAYNWFLMGNQMALADGYPSYNASTEKCRFDKSTPVASPRPRGVPYPIRLNHNETALKEVIKTVGPVPVSVSVNWMWSTYRSGIYYDPDCKPTNTLNHAVLCVGYGTENGTDYWIIKNSWGPNWGEGGYMRLRRNVASNCGIAYYGSAPKI